MEPARASGDSRKTAEPARLDVARVRADFPILERQIHGKPLVYLDSAASTQRPVPVIEAVSRFYEEHNANIHRGVHTLSQEATRDFEAARDSVRDFIGAAESREIVFCRGTTEAINLVAQSFGRSRLRPGDEILISGMEHHSNIVPWQLLCEQVGTELRVVPITDDGELRIEDVERCVGPKTRLVAVVHTSNALGTINPVKEIVEIAHRRGAVVVVDGAQAVAHEAVDVADLGCDFFAFSGHKMYGPTGIGVLYGRAELLEEMPPWQGGGEMIRSVTFEKTTFNDLPFKFEAGTPNVAGGIGLGAAIDYLEALGCDAVAAHERELLDKATRTLAAFPGVRLIGTAPHKAAVCSFVMDGVHAHDIGTVLDTEGIAIRTGHHCAQPVMQRFGVPATARASFGVYNTAREIDALAAGLDKVRELFR
ncbi:MAG: cysteine desulfurase [Acidobacteriota bacterium]|nr:cysteine desulfurase [Acidobacteriota bacterium]